MINSNLSKIKQSIMNSYTQLVTLIDTIKTEGKTPKVIKLKSQINKKRKSLI